MNGGAGGRRFIRMNSISYLRERGPISHPDLTIGQVADALRQRQGRVALLIGVLRTKARKKALINPKAQSKLLLRHSGSADVIREFLHV